MVVPRALPLALVAITVLVGSSVAEAGVSPPSDGGSGSAQADAGDAGASDPQGGGTVGGGGGCSIATFSAPEPAPLGLLGGGAALLVVSRRRRT